MKENMNSIFCHIKKKQQKRPSPMENILVGTKVSLIPSEYTFLKVCLEWCWQWFRSSDTLFRTTIVRSKCKDASIEKEKTTKFQTKQYGNVKGITHGRTRFDELKPRCLPKTYQTAKNHWTYLLYLQRT